MIGNIINGDTFEDGMTRVCVQYEGWCCIDKDGVKKKDEMTKSKYGPLRIIPDPLSHGRWHTLDNILNLEGEKILPRGVRYVKYYRDGYYLLKDNNEDELINRGDVKGGFKASDYIERFNIVLENGRLLSNEWFDDISPAVMGYFKIIQNGKENFIDFNGNKFSLNVPNLTCFDGKNGYYFSGSSLYKVTKDEEVKVKQLVSCNCPGQYIIGRDLISLRTVEQNELIDIAVEDFMPIGNCENRKFNFLMKGGYLLFDNWYEKYKVISKITGRFAVKLECGWQLVDITEKPIVNTIYEDIILGNEYFFGYLNGKYDVYNSDCQIIAVGLDSVMWADNGIWGMNIEEKGVNHHYFIGEAGDILNYAQSVLVSNEKSIFLGKNGKWNYYDGSSPAMPYINFFEYTRNND